MAKEPCPRFPMAVRCFSLSFFDANGRFDPRKSYHLQWVGCELGAFGKFSLFPWWIHSVTPGILIMGDWFICSLIAQISFNW